MPQHRRAETTDVARRISVALALTGTALVVGTSLLGDLGLALLLLVAWSLLPYGVLAGAGPRLTPWTAAGMGVAALAVEVGIRLAVFVFPRGSTAAIGLLFSPPFILVVAMPIGAAIGWLVEWTARVGRRTLQGVLLAASATAAVLTVIGIGRPDLFPTTVLARNRAIERIGPPRVVVGAGRFERIPVGPRATWRMVGDVDGQPGDEIAIVEGNALQLYAPDTLGRGTTIPLGEEARRRWNWFSQPARADDQLVIAETGGGFQETQARNLDGSIRWTYRPDRSLPPSALVPADLDGDGLGEFYATTNDALVRLDGTAREVWRTRVVNATVSFTAPRTSRDPAWVVTAGQPGRVTVTGADGAHVADLAIPDGSAVGFVDWPDGRFVLAAGSALRVVRLDGHVALEWRVPDMSIVQAVPVTWQPGEPARLAVLAGGPRDTKRWRLQLVALDGTVAYDEVLDAMPRLMKAAGPAGVDTLLLSGSDLLALRPLAAPGTAEGR